MKPKDFVINKEVIRTQAREYLRNLIVERRNLLIEKGMWVPPKIKILKKNTIKEDIEDLLVDEYIRVK